MSSSFSSTSLIGIRLNRAPSCKCRLLLAVHQVSEGNNVKPLLGYPYYDTPSNCKHFLFVDDKGSEEPRSREAHNNKDEV